MQSPVLFEIAAFDAAKDFTFSFSWQGAQAMGSRLTIRKNEDNTVLFSGNNISMKQVFRLPSDSLENGICYNAFLEILDRQETVISDRSNVIVFYCYTTPTLVFNNISNNTVIGNSSFTVSADYTQAEGESLTQYQISVYDLNRVPIQSQGIRHLTKPASQIEATVTSLENDGSYYIRATGETLNHMAVDTDYVLVNVKYIQPSMFSFVDLKNVGSKGYISVTSNLITLRGKAHIPEEELEYLDGAFVDLSEDGRYIQFSDGFSFSKDFTLGYSCFHIPLNASILRWGDGTYHAGLYYRQAAFDSQNGAEKGYFELLVENPIGFSIINSDYITPVTDRSKYTIWITKKDGLYRVSCTDEGEYTEGGGTV